LAQAIYAEIFQARSRSQAEASFGESRRNRHTPFCQVLRAVL